MECQQAFHRLIHQSLLSIGSITTINNGLTTVNNTLNSAITDCIITVGTELTNVVNVSVQVKTKGNANPSVPVSVKIYLSDSSSGTSLVASAPSQGIGIGTNGLFIPLVANKAGMIVSNASGLFDMNITEEGSKTSYLVVILPNGLIKVSSAITHTA